MNTQIELLSDIELKAAMYDNIVMMDRIKNNMNMIKGELAKRFKQQEEEKMKEVKDENGGVD